MKPLRSTLAMLASAIITALFPREECVNEASSAKTHATGMVPYVAEVAITTRYLLVQKGAADNGIILNVANTRPWGVCQDEPAIGVKTTVALLGVTPGTLKVRAAKAIAAGAKLYTAAGGLVTDTYAAGAFYVGRAITAALAANDLVEFAHCAPLLDASGTTL